MWRTTLLLRTNCSLLEEVRGPFIGSPPGTLSAYESLAMLNLEPRFVLTLIYGKDWLLKVVGNWHSKRRPIGGPHRSVDLPSGPTLGPFGPIFRGLAFTVDWGSPKSVSSQRIMICSDKRVHIAFFWLNPLAVTNSPKHVELISLKTVPMLVTHFKHLCRVCWHIIIVDINNHRLTRVTSQHREPSFAPLIGLPHSLRKIPQAIINNKREKVLFDLQFCVMFDSSLPHRKNRCLIFSNFRNQWNLHRERFKPLLSPM